jgi:hypothetical protein
VQAAAATWSAAGAAFTFTYAGTTSATGSSNNGQNEIFWDSTPEDPNASALTTTWSTGNDIIECDIAFNDAKTWSTTGEADKQDVQSVALHELGHCLMLTDLYGDVGDGMNDVGKVLCGVGIVGVAKRSLATADTAGILCIYGAASTLGITVTPLTWAVAGLQPQGGTCLTTAGTRFTVTNMGNVTETLKLRIATQDNLGKWLAGSLVGADQYWLRALFCGDPDTPVGTDFGAEDTVTTTAQSATSTRFNRPAGTYGVAMAASAFAYLWFRLDLPNPVSDGSQHQITVEVSCATP